ncbi:MAG: sialidase family protein [Pirellulales bacterium]
MAAIVWAGEPVVLDQGNVPHHPHQPQVSVDADGDIHVVYGLRGRARYRRSDDGGQSFSQPVDLPSVNVMSLGMRRGPRIALSGKAINVTVIAGKQGKGKDGDLWAMKSEDGGTTWADPVRVNDVPDSAREGLHAMSAGPDGVLCCVWLDLRSGRTEIMASVSRDHGDSWGTNVLVYRSPDGSVCECCHPGVVIDGRGRISVQWRNALEGARDMYVASSVNGGKSFDQGSRLGRGTWLLDACPMDGGALAVSSRGQLASVWRRDHEVFVWREGQAEERLVGPGEQPWIVATDAGEYIIWLERRGEAAYLLAPGDRLPIKLADHAADPVIAVGPNGRGPVVAVWEEADGKHFVVRCQAITAK